VGLRGRKGRAAGADRGRRAPEQERCRCSGGSPALALLPVWQRASEASIAAAKSTADLADAGGTLVAVPTAWILAAFAVAAQAATGSRVLLESAAGKIESRELAGFECTDPRAVGAALVRFEGLKVPPAPATDDEKAELALPGGDHLFGRIHGGRAELVDIEILGGVHLGLALDEITSLVFPARIPAHGTIVPTERSKFPEARQKSIVQEMMPTVETASSSESRLRSVKKSLTVNEQTMTSTARMASMPACSSQLPSCVRIHGGAAAGAPAAGELPAAGGSERLVVRRS